MEDFISQWGYIALFLYSFGGGFVGLVIASILAYGGELNIYLVVLTALVSNFIGDQFLFYIARNNKEYAKSIMAKYGRKVAYAHLLMRRYGWVAIFIQKYIYGIKTLIPLAIGLTKYSSKNFMLFNLISTIIWAILVGSVAYLLGEVVYEYIDEFKYYGLGVIVLIILGVSYLFKKI